MLRLLRLIRLMPLEACAPSYLKLRKLFKNLWLIVVGFRESLSTLFWGIPDVIRADILTS